MGRVGYGYPNLKAYEVKVVNLKAKNGRKMTIRLLRPVVYMDMHPTDKGANPCLHTGCPHCRNGHKPVEFVMQRCINRNLQRIGKYPVMVMAMPRKSYYSDVKKIKSKNGQVVGGNYVYCEPDRDQWGCDVTCSYNRYRKLRKYRMINAGGDPTPLTDREMKYKHPKLRLKELQGIAPNRQSSNNVNLNSKQQQKGIKVGRRYRYKPLVPQKEGRPGMTVPVYIPGELFKKADRVAAKVDLSVGLVVRVFMKLGENGVKKLFHEKNYDRIVEIATSMGD